MINFQKISKFCALSLGIFLFWSFPIFPTKQLIFLAEEINYSHQDIIKKIIKANIVYLGETHDSVVDHQKQLDIIQKLYQRNQKIAIAWEMFQLPYQSFLDDYLTSKISETELKQKTEYEKRWGFDWEYYAPILRFAQAHQLPLVALNTPSEITRKVSQAGLESLTESELEYIPPKEEIDLNNQDYRQMLLDIYQQHSDAGHGNSDGFERFFLAQVLWDETMAQTIALFHQKNPEYQIVVLAGKGHLIYDYGIPSRVERRLNQHNLLQYSIFMGSQQQIKLQGEKPAADYFW